MICKVAFDEIYLDENFEALVQEYGEECSALGVPEPQPDLYRMLEAGGGMQVFGVYEDEKLVGFASVLVYILPHFGRKVASSESVFLSAKNRKCWVGIDLLEEMKEYAKEAGCEKFLFSAPVDSNFAQLLSILYPHISNVYMVDL